ncbi:hypothetical protein Acr_24g0009270 [Actinidia rufa]|uniref:Uncharacterized protein n=1 Tax=Actinidia rufa TaxID=165716 RepID=A0A7J0GV61_9ERIC|nr:hypothetical protein Acr_24g0009270 [Actinidia rufa]
MATTGESPSRYQNPKPHRPLSLASSLSLSVFICRMLEEGGGYGDFRWLWRLDVGFFGGWWLGMGWEWRGCAGSGGLCGRQAGCSGFRIK